MSIILKGIDLPKEQSLLVFIANNGAVVCSGEDGVTTTKAIQIPKGARLIDANKLEIHEIVNNPILRDFAYVYADDIEYAPTILESEEEGEKYRECANNK